MKRLLKLMTVQPSDSHSICALKFHNYAVLQRKLMNENGYRSFGTVPDLESSGKNCVRPGEFWTELCQIWGVLERIM